MSALPEHVVRLSDLPNRRPSDIALSPTAEERAAVAHALGLTDLKKLRFEAQLSPAGGKDWHLTGNLGATVVQDCVVTLDPVTTRIDEPVERRYMAELPEPEAAEVEMPEDDTAEPLLATLDLANVMIEALSLALPAYPRSDGADIGELVVTEPGATPLTQSQMKPFAGLAALRDKLGSDTPDDAE